MMSDAPEQLELDVPGGPIAALAWGPPDARPVLGVHGWLDNAATWHAVGPLLDDLRFVSVDFPGHGQSFHRSPGQMYHFVDLIPAIFDVADTLEWEIFSVLGHSMGAAAAMMAAGTSPERLDRMVLVDGLGPWTTPDERAPEQLAEGLGERSTLLDKDKRRFDDVDHACRVLAEIYGLSSDALRPMVDRGTDATDDGRVEFSYDLLLRASSLVRFTEAQVLAFLEGIEAPTRLIRPDGGWPVDADMVERRTGAIRPLETVDVEGGHHVHLESPQEVAELAEGFLTG